MNETPFAANLADLVKGRMEANHLVFKAGYDAGYKKGFSEAVAEAKKVVDATFGQLIKDKS